MVLFFIITLGLSILGMAALLGFKRYELATGRVFLAVARPHIASSLERGVQWVGHTLPAQAAELARVEGAKLRMWLHVTLARAVLSLEHTLERVLHVVREKTEPDRPVGEASAFLREVANHKKKLQRRAPERREIKEQ
jgi:hypothetical protein